MQYPRLTLNYVRYILLLCSDTSAQFHALAFIKSRGFMKSLFRRKIKCVAEYLKNKASRRRRSLYITHGIYVFSRAHLFLTE